MENTDKIITEETNLVIPEHVALILDGNGRWAKKRGLPRTADFIFARSPKPRQSFPRDERLIHTHHYPVRWPSRQRPHLHNILLKKMLTTS